MHRVSPRHPEVSSSSTSSSSLSSPSSSSIGLAVILIVSIMVMVLGCAPPTEDATATGNENATTSSESSDPWTLQQVQAGEISMRVATQGEGPLVLFLHGFPESWYSWRYQLPALADAGFLAAAPDMRGYGGTDAPEDIAAYSMEHLCNDVEALANHFSPNEPAVLVGHDWGAAVAWGCMTRVPERFRAVAALSVPTGPRAPQPFTEILRATHGDNFFYLLYFQEPGVAEAEFDPDPRELLQRVYASPDTPREPAEISDPLASAGGWLGRIGKPTELPPWLSQEELDYYVDQFQGGFRGGLNYYRNLDRNWELSADVDPIIEQPALFVAGALDGVIAGANEEQLRTNMSQTVTDLRGVHVLDGAGHWIQQERADDVNRLLIEFLQGLEATAAPAD